MKIEKINGDVTKATERVIAHNVNCQGIMGSGVAYYLKLKFRNLYSEYIKFIATKLSEGDKTAILLGNMQPVKVADDKYVCNLFAQDFCGYGKQFTDNDAFKTCLEKLKDFCIKNNIYDVAMPYKIGCGRGGAIWEEVYDIIVNVFNDSDINIKLYYFEE